MATKKARAATPKAALPKLVQTDREVPPKREENVSFEVLCRPRSGAPLAGFADLALETVEGFQPAAKTAEEVARHLQAAGFQVHLTGSDTSVSAEGPYGLFEKVFVTKLRKRERTLTGAGAERKFEFFDTVKDAPEPAMTNVPGALYAAIQRPPVYHAASPLPPPAKYFHLRVPGDVAMLTKASQAHRKSTVGGDRATGLGVRVAMLDSGFFMHPYFVEHGYRLNPTAASDAVPPATLDADGHGTGEVANVFATAPDATVFGVKMGSNPVLSFNKATSLAVKVITNSWGYGLTPTTTTLPAPLVPLRLAILSAISSGITVVFSGGNGPGGFSFPAQMPEVIAVGGVYADQNAKLRAANYASSFISPIYPGRRVPDFCGLCGENPRGIYIMLPIPEGSAIDTGFAGGAFPNKDETAANDGWGVFSGTSAAAPQVAGICALLLQKKPTLTPAQIKSILTSTATDVTTGVSAMGHAAGAGVDLATGTGLVNALLAWQSA